MLPHLAVFTLHPYYVSSSVCAGPDMATALFQQAQHKEQLLPHQQQQRHLHRSPIKKLQQLAARKERQITSLLVVTQVLRLLLSLVSDPAAAHTVSQFRSQLLKELEAAAAAACLDGDQPLTALTLLQHLPAARLQQLREAAKMHPRKHSRRASKAVSGAGSSADLGSSSNSQASSSSSARQLLPGTLGPSFVLGYGEQPAYCLLQAQQQLHGTPTPAAAAAAAATRHAPAAPLQQQQQQQLDLLPSQLLFEALGAPVLPMDVGCLLETTLVVAAAEAQINSLSFEPPGSNSLQDDACSKVNIEGVLLEEFELAQLNGLV
jgi:hypothetical protein